MVLLRRNNVSKCSLVDLGNCYYSYLCDYYNSSKDGYTMGVTDQAIAFKGARILKNIVKEKRAMTEEEALALNKLVGGSQSGEINPADNLLRFAQAKLGDTSLSSELLSDIIDKLSDFSSSGELPNLEDLVPSVIDSLSLDSETKSNLSMLIGAII